MIAMLHCTVSTSAISDWGHQIQLTECGDFLGHRGPHDGKETPQRVAPSWSASPMVSD